MSDCDLRRANYWLGVFNLVSAALCILAGNYGLGVMCGVIGIALIAYAKSRGR